MPRPARPPLLLPALILLGLGLRVLRLDFQPLWWDEGYSVWFAGHSLPDMLRLTAQDIHPPLYYALLHLWAQLFGFAPLSLRLFSLAAGLPAIPLAYLLGRDLFDRRAGLLAAAIVAVNPLAIFYSQEVRMYGLAATFSLAALWSGWRWIQTRRGRGVGVVYLLSLLGGLYTLYYFALLPLAQGLWMALAPRPRRRRWPAPFLAAGLLYLPWLLYAGPKLLDYVAYKVVQDNDTPLALLPYVGRHLSAFLLGHLEGDLAPLWAWGLLLLLPAAAALAIGRRQAGGAGRGSPLLYLLLPLLLALSVGFIQQLRAPFIPARFERVLLFAAPALWLLLALGLRQLARQARSAALLSGLWCIIALAASLSTFYTTPRYAERDYRPLLRQVQAAADFGEPSQTAATDSFFAIYPWQIGYFWAYVAAPGPDHPAHLSRSQSWGPALQAQLDALLARGDVWFPAHLSLGGILEGAVEAHLDRSAYQLANTWHGPETRLTAWTPTQPDLIWEALPTPLAWQNGLSLTQARLTPATFSPAQPRLRLEFTWSSSAAIDPAGLTLSLWLSDAGGRRWAQRDLTPFGHPWPALDPASPRWPNQDRIAWALPVGLPPGVYDLSIALLAADQTPIALAGANPAPQAWLGSLALPAGLALPGQMQPRFPAAVGDAIHFRGHDRDPAPLRTGDDLALTLFWQPRIAPAADYFVFVQLLDENRVVAGLEEPPLAWRPTSAWPPGLPVRSQQRLRIPAALPAGDYRLIAGLFAGDGTRLRWGRGDFIELGRVQVLARDHDFTPPAPQHPLELTLAGGHRLAGYDLVAGNSPGSPINLTLHWQPAGPTDPRYSVFVHLLDERDAIRDQSDAQPADGAHPTTSWLAGESVTDSHTLALPRDLSAGPFRLALGLYNPITGERLPFIAADGAVIADHLVLLLGE